MRLWPHLFQPILVKFLPLLWGWLRERIYFLPILRFELIFLSLLFSTFERLEIFGRLKPDALPQQRPIRCLWLWYMKRRFKVIMSLNLSVGAWCLTGKVPFGQQSQLFLLHPFDFGGGLDLQPKNETENVKNYSNPKIHNQAKIYNSFSKLHAKKVKF